ncbi:hypothetical protein ACFQH9_07295 [Pseudonocardia lutea]|uniref:Fe2OG dioxygenase domain-containing protein n=1 Tax=Pseudonocardia lutea TaxID=2172015 RepID=A0ABW1I6R8_9PSEU
MQLLERRTLTEVTGGDGGPEAATDLAFARYHPDYDDAGLAAVLAHARELHAQTAAETPAGERHLGLDHLRRVQDRVPEVREMVHDRERLDRLSEFAGVELEPYPIPTSCSGVNFYRPGQPPIALHRDGPAFVELVPLYADGSQDGGSTLVYRGPADVGAVRAAQGELPASELVAVPQRVGSAVLLQGRMLLHTAELLTDGHRVTLVLSLRSRAEPWKDTNTLGRLLRDDRPEDVAAAWEHDVETRQLPALRRHLLG